MNDVIYVAVVLAEMPPLLSLILMRVLYSFQKCLKMIWRYFYYNFMLNGIQLKSLLKDEVTALAPFLFYWLASFSFALLLL